MEAVSNHETPSREGVSQRLLADLQIDLQIFKSNDYLKILGESWFDPGSSFTAASFSESQLAAIKKNLVEELSYENQVLAPLPVLSSQMAPLLLQSGYVISGSSLIDVNSVYNANAVNKLDREIPGRLNGNRTVRLASIALQKLAPNDLLVRWGGDEFLIFTKTENQDQTHFKQQMAVFTGPTSFFNKKNLLVAEHISVKTESFLEARVDERPYLRQESVTLAEIKQRIAVLQKGRPQLEDFFQNQVVLEEKNLSSLNRLLEIIENSYFDPLLSKAAVELKQELEKENPGQTYT